MPISIVPGRTVSPGSRRGQKSTDPVRALRKNAREMPDWLERAFGIRDALALYVVHKSFGSSPSRRNLMLQAAIGLLVLALIAAVFGFGGIAAGFAGIAKVLFVVFLALAAVSFFFGRRGGLTA